MMESKTQQTSGAVTWVAVTDGERLRILEITDDNQSLQQVDVADLFAAVREQVKADDVVAGGPDSDGEQDEPGVVTDLFSTDYKRRMSACLEGGRQLGLYDRVVAIAPPAVLGAFVDRLNPRVQDALIIELQADLVDSDAAAIRKRLPL